MAKWRLGEHNPNLLMGSFVMSDPELLEIPDDLNEKITREINMSMTTIKRRLKDDLNLKPLKKCPAQMFFWCWQAKSCPEMQGFVKDAHTSNYMYQQYHLLRWENVHRRTESELSKRQDIIMVQAVQTSIQLSGRPDMQNFQRKPPRKGQRYTLLLDGGLVKRWDSKDSWLLIVCHD